MSGFSIDMIGTQLESTIAKKCDANGDGRIDGNELAEFQRQMQNDKATGGKCEVSSIFQNGTTTTTITAGRENNQTWTTRFTEGKNGTEYSLEIMDDGAKTPRNMEKKFYDTKGTLRYASSETSNERYGVWNSTEQMYNEDGSLSCKKTLNKPTINCPESAKSTIDFYN